MARIGRLVFRLETEDRTEQGLQSAESRLDSFFSKGTQLAASFAAAMVGAIGQFLEGLDEGERRIRDLTTRLGFVGLGEDAQQFSAGLSAITGADSAQAASAAQQVYGAGLPFGGQEATALGSALARGELAGVASSDVARLAQAFNQPLTPEILDRILSGAQGANILPGEFATDALADAVEAQSVGFSLDQYLAILQSSLAAGKDPGQLVGGLVAQSGARNIAGPDLAAAAQYGIRTADSLAEANFISAELLGGEYFTQQIRSGQIDIAGGDFQFYRRGNQAIVPTTEEAFEAQRFYNQQYGNIFERGAAYASGLGGEIPYIGEHIEDIGYRLTGGAGTRGQAPSLVVVNVGGSVLADSDLAEIIRGVVAESPAAGGGSSQLPRSRRFGTVG